MLAAVAIKSVNSFNTHCPKILRLDETKIIVPPRNCNSSF